MSPWRSGTASANPSDPRTRRAERSGGSAARGGVSGGAGTGRLRGVRAGSLPPAGGPVRASRVRCGRCPAARPIAICCSARWPCNWDSSPAIRRPRRCGLGCRRRAGRSATCWRTAATLSAERQSAAGIAGRGTPRPTRRRCRGEFDGDQSAARGSGRTASDRRPRLRRRADRLGSRLPDRRRIARGATGRAPRRGRDAVPHPQTPRDGRPGAGVGGAGRGTRPGGGPQGDPAPPCRRRRQPRPIPVGSGGDGRPGAPRRRAGLRPRRLRRRPPLLRHAVREGRQPQDRDRTVSRNRSLVILVLLLHSRFPSRRLAVGRLHLARVPQSAGPVRGRLQRDRLRSQPRRAAPRPEARERDVGALRRNAGRGLGTGEGARQAGRRHGRRAKRRDAVQPPPALLKDLGAVPPSPAARWVRRRS